MNDNSFYEVWESSPLDYWENYTHISDFGDNIVNHIQKFPKLGLDFYSIWNSIIRKLFFIYDYEKLCHGLDSLRDINFYARFDEPTQELSDFCSRPSVIVAYKLDNNGTCHLVRNFCYSTPKGTRSKIFPHDFGCEWEKIYEPERNKE